MQNQTLHEKNQRKISKLKINSWTTPCRKTIDVQNSSQKPTRKHQPCFQFIYLKISMLSTIFLIFFNRDFNASNKTLHFYTEFSCQSKVPFIKLKN